jgi:hypothetical protein
MANRITKDELVHMAALGALKPVGHVLIAFADQDAVEQAKSALREGGFQDGDVISYTSAELFPNLDDMLRKASGAAGFGYEITLMRRYMTLASEGAGWLLVYAPDDAQTGAIQDIARRLGAKSAVHYGRLVHEDLIG